MRTIELAGTELHLLADRAVWIATEQTLLIADVHLGKAEALQRAGLALPAPDPACHPDLRRIDQLLTRHRPQRLIVLGDLIHATAARGSGWLVALAQLIGAQPDCEFALVIGNHDRALGSLRELMAIWPEGSRLAGLALHHAPPRVSVVPWIAGHIHPVVRVRSGRLKQRCPVFWRSSRGLVLPAFGSQTGGYAVSPGVGDTCYACDEEAVYLLSQKALNDRARRSHPPMQR